MAKNNLQAPRLERLTVLVRGEDIRRIKHIAIDRRISTSEVIREAVHEIVDADQKQVRRRALEFNEAAT